MWTLQSIWHLWDSMALVYLKKPPIHELGNGIDLTLFLKSRVWLLCEYYSYSTYPCMCSSNIEPAYNKYSFIVGHKGITHFVRKRIRLQGFLVHFLLIYPPSFVGLKVFCRILVIVVWILEFSNHANDITWICIDPVPNAVSFTDKNKELAYMYMCYLS